MWCGVLLQWHTVVGGHCRVADINRCAGHDLQIDVAILIIGIDDERWCSSDCDTGAFHLFIFLVAQHLCRVLVEHRLQHQP